jgi:hypothetical protein
MDLSDSIQNEIIEAFRKRNVTQLVRLLEAIQASEADGEKILGELLNED